MAQRADPSKAGIDRGFPRRTGQPIEPEEWEPAQKRSEQEGSKNYQTCKFEIRRRRWLLPVIPKAGEGFSRLECHIARRIFSLHTAQSMAIYYEGKFGPCSDYSLCPGIAFW